MPWFSNGKEIKIGKAWTSNDADAVQHPANWASVWSEDEIKQNSWININEELDLLFNMDSEKKWANAIKRTGIDFTKFSSYSGNA